MTNRRAQALLRALVKSAGSMDKAAAILAPATIGPLHRSTIMRYLNGRFMIPLFVREALAVWGATREVSNA